MQVASAAQDLQKTTKNWNAQSLRAGFVPTMGALHDGHLSLVEIARMHADKVVVSIFVNPTQFAPHEDFDSYPRQVESDLQKLESAGTDLVYLPSVQDIYPDAPVPVSTLHKTDFPAAQGLESDFRPHFFAGVTNVVRRLFTQVTPDIAVFGEKDFQQLQVIREMVAAERLPVEIIGAPIARDEFGLALSSRNAYLSAAELEIARGLNKVLYSLATSLRANAESEAIQLSDSGLLRQPDGFLAMTEDAKSRLLAHGFDKVDYLEIRWNRLLAAVWLGKTRLIDNVAL